VIEVTFLVRSIMAVSIRESSEQLLDLAYSSVPHITPLFNLRNNHSQANKPIVFEVNVTDYPDLTERYPKTSRMLVAAAKPY
jgi:hypothetical protein